METLMHLGITIGIGLLIGLEREFSHQHDKALFAGARTFPLVALIGYLSSFLSVTFASWIFGVAFAGIIALVTSSYIILAKKGDIGATTEFSVIITFIAGALVHLDHIALAVAIGVIVTLLLSLKLQFRELLGKFNHADIFALLKFLIMLAIVLPVLPDQTFGPYNVINPKQIWYMIVLITGVSFLGYILVKTVGSEKGIQLTSILGGIASSTAITWDFSKKSKEQPDFARHYGIGILLASSIMFVRVWFLVYLLNQQLAFRLAFPLIFLTCVGLGISIFLLKREPLQQFGGEVKVSNPLNLGDAAKFAVIFSIVLLLVKVGEQYLGTQGVYIVSAFSGLTEMDAIAISMTKFSIDENTAFIAMNAIVSATLSNTLFKAALTLINGDKSIAKMIFWSFGALTSTGILYLISVNTISR